MPVGYPCVSQHVTEHLAYESLDLNGAGTTKVMARARVKYG